MPTPPHPPAPTPLTSIVTAPPVAVSPERFHCGEGPMFEADRAGGGVVWWTDIDAGRILRLKLSEPAKSLHTAYTARCVGGFTLQKDGRLLLFRDIDIVLFDPETGVISPVAEFSDPGSERFNDVASGPDGAVFAGSIGRDSTSGGLFHLSTTGQLTTLFRGTGCANGMAWSPAGDTFYFTDTTARCVYAFDYRNGTISNRRPLFTVPDAYPDGLAVDTEGCLWSARWSGHCITRHAPDGRELERIPLPAKNVTSLCFAGPDMRDVYITSANRDDRENPVGGCTFHLRSKVAGLPRFRSDVQQRA